MIKLSQIFYYPLKSAKAVSLNKAILDEKGISGDRRWMVVNPDFTFLSQRQFPELALILAVPGPDNSLQLSAPGMSSVKVNHLPDSHKQEAKIWKDWCPALPANAAADEWISDYLKTPARLVFMPDGSQRKIDRSYSINDHTVSFADGYPFLLISEPSVKFLNKLQASPTPMDRFRPNFVISGCTPHEEDNWTKIMIGEIIFHLVKPCTRCVVTTVDQDSGERGKEPLQTLAIYRRKDGKILFGQNLTHENTGTVQAGESVKILE